MNASRSAVTTIEFTNEDFCRAMHAMHKRGIYAGVQCPSVRHVRVLQWLICKKISVGTPSAEGARIEAPQAPRGVGCVEGVYPSPPGEGAYNFEIFIPKW